MGRRRPLSTTDSKHGPEPCFPVASRTGHLVGLYRLWGQTDRREKRYLGWQQSHRQTLPVEHLARRANRARMIF